MRLVGAFLAVLLTAAQLHANPEGPPDQMTGAPGESDCRACHGGALSTASPVSIVAPTRYVPGGGAMDVTIRISTPQSLRNGFELVAKNAAQTVAGTLATAGDGRTQVSAGYGKQTQTGSLFASLSNPVEWTLRWTPPATPGGGTIQFYAAGNATDNNNICGDGKDRISLTSLAVAENHPPTTPALLTPADDGFITSASATLSLNEAADSDGDPLSYAFELCQDAGCVTVLASVADIAGNGATASWQISDSLTDNTAYWWRARASDGYVTTAWSPTRQFTFYVNQKPTAPSLHAPGDAGGADVVVTTSQPTLSVNLAADADAEDTLAYRFELCSDAACGAVLTTSPQTATAPGDTLATWVADALTENALYFWRARAWDGLEYGPYMSPVSFWVNAVTEAPARPVIVEPFPNGRAFGTTAPTLSVANTTDPDPLSAPLRYDFTLADDAGFLSVVTTATGIPEGSAGHTHWNLTDLTDMTTYYLRVVARDTDGNASPAATASFSIDLTNDAPTAPGSPEPGGVTVATPQPILTANAATDEQLDDVLTYYFDLDTQPTFASAALQSSGAQVSPSWVVPNPLSDRRYYWRVRAYDGKTFGAAATASFWVDAINDPPQAPLPSEPIGGAQVNTRSPLLRAWPAFDPEGDPLRYEFELSLTSDFSTALQHSNAVYERAGMVQWQPRALPDNVSLFWRVRAKDDGDPSIAGPFSATATFEIVNGNLPPGSPAVTGDKKQRADEPVVFTAENMEDPDGDAVMLFYEVFLDSMLQVPLASSPGIASGAPEWEPNYIEWTRGIYYWRVRSHDGVAYGPYSPTAKLELTVEKLPFEDEKYQLPDILVDATPVHESGCRSAGGAMFLEVLLPLGLLLLRRRGLLALLFIFSAACGEADAPLETTKVEAPPRYADVQAIFNTRCVMCHLGGKASNGLDLGESKQGAGLIGKEPVNPVAKDRGFLLVDAGKPENSFLLYKLTEPGLGEGARMPFERPPIEPGQVALIREWIQAGASLD